MGKDSDSTSAATTGSTTGTGEPSSSSAVAGSESSSRHRPDSRQRQASSQSRNGSGPQSASASHARVDQAAATDGSDASSRGDDNASNNGANASNHSHQRNGQDWKQSNAASLGEQDDTAAEESQVSEVQSAASTAGVKETAAEERHRSDRVKEVRAEGSYWVAVSVSPMSVLTRRSERAHYVEDSPLDTQSLATMAAVLLVTALASVTQTTSLMHP